VKLIYVVFLSSDNLMGKLIRCFTRHAFNHTAISLDESLMKMYSFARRQKRSPLVGGFVVETPSRYFGGKGKVPLKIAEVALDERQYSSVLATIEDFERRQGELIYNSIDAFFSLFSIRVHIRDSHTCYSFVAQALNLKGIGNISDLEKHVEKSLVYTGDIKSYINGPIGENPFYFETLSKRTIAIGTIRHFWRLFARGIAPGRR